MLPQNPKSKTWEGRIASIVLAVYKRKPVPGPVCVDLEFYFRRPKNHFGTGKNAHTLKDSVPYHPCSRGDVDKLARAVLDALTGDVLSNGGARIGEGLGRVRVVLGTEMDGRITASSTPTCSRSTTTSA